MKKLILITCLIFINSLVTVYASPIKIEITLPTPNVQPFHRPYVAIWVEDSKRTPVSNVSAWLGDEKWHKDLRQWWRKIGRKNIELDGITGATRRPNTYKVNWDGTDFKGNPVPNGSYLLNIEAVREDGDRSYQRIPFTIPATESITITAQREFGPVTISFK